jgi:hypothetical protein
MKTISRLIAFLLLAPALCLSGCGVSFPQRIDNLGTPACKAQVLESMEQLLLACHETPEVARTLAASALTQMESETIDTPRPGSRLAADLRVLTTDVKVASSSGNTYYIYADLGLHRVCRLRLKSEDVQLYPRPRALSACLCEPAQG